jgi:hypothetical protein
VEDSARAGPGVNEGARGGGNVPTATGIEGVPCEPVLVAAAVTAAAMASSVSPSARGGRRPRCGGRGRLNR